MQRITEGFTTLPVQLQLDGLPMVPVPAQVVSLTLLKVNLPFTMPVLENGVFLIGVEGHTPHLFRLNGMRFPYTWMVNFVPASQDGDF